MLHNQIQIETFCTTIHVMRCLYFLLDKWDNEDLIVEGLASVSEAPAVITDIGMRAVGVCFPRIKHMDIYNCPHILRPTQWFTQGKSTQLHTCTIKEQIQIATYFSNTLKNGLVFFTYGNTAS